MICPKCKYSGQERLFNPDYNDGYCYCPNCATWFRLTGEDDEDENIGDEE